MRLDAHVGPFYNAAMDPVPVLMRWLHIGSIVVLVGGGFFLRVVLIPALGAVSDESRAALRPVLLARWKIVLRACMTFILVSGFYNFLVVTRPRHAGQGSYDVLIYVKIVLALALFGIAEALVLKDPKRWLPLNLALAAVIIALSAYLKFLPVMS